MTLPDFAILRSDDAVPAHLKGGVVAIGNFDGVHRGHRVVLDTAVRRAREAGRPVLALTFEPHPRSFFRPQTPVFRLTPGPVKAEVISRLGFDAVVEKRFDAELAALPAEAFVEEILVRRLAVSAVVVGHDFHFGKARGGTPEVLAELGARHGFAVEIVEAAGEDGEIFSSSAVREALASGRVEDANEILGYRWYVRGEVIHGEKRGRDLGFPTANLQLAPETELKHGIYAVWAGLDGRRLRAVASYGRRPQFDNGAPLLEVHLMDFQGDLYGRELDVEFVRFLRAEAKFESVEALVAQMREDTRQARQVLDA